MESFMPEPARKPEENVILSPNTWFLMLDVPTETPVAHAWCEKNAPVKLEQDMLTNVLHMSSLRKDNAVVIIQRRAVGMKRITPAIGLYLDRQTGERMPEPAALEDLVAEVKLSEPVLCSKHWQDGGGGYGQRWNGSLSRSTFLEELGKLASPATIRFLDVASKKGGELPEQLVLRTE
jgi:hypothetical protein